MRNKVVSLFDLTGNMVAPWAGAGYECWIVDTAHPPGITAMDQINLVNHDLSTPWLPTFNRNEIAFVAAFPVCTDLAVSGARWFKGKGLRRLAKAIEMFASAAEFCEWSGAPYMIENPISTISTYWRKPDYTFSPDQFTMFAPQDNYTKRTCLWVGNGFVMPRPAKDHSLGDPDDRIHKCPPSADRANIRSETPIGFTRAVFEANHDAIVGNRERKRS